MSMMSETLNKDELKEELFESLRDTLETMAFAEVLPDNNDSLFQISQDTEIIWSRVAIHSEKLKSAELVLPLELAQDLADTMYAGMAPEEAGTVFDTVAELTNTLAGKFMLSLGGKAGDFFLDVPESGEGVPALGEGAVVSQCVVDEIHPVRITLGVS